MNRSKEFAKLAGERYKVSAILITNSFPKIDKDLKTDFLVSTIAVFVEINFHPAESRFLIIAASLFSCLLLI